MAWTCCRRWAVVLAFSKETIAAVVGAAALPFLRRSALARSGFVVVGGLVTLHSGIDRLTADKVVYALGVTLAAGIATFRVVERSRGHGSRGPFAGCGLWPSASASWCSVPYAGAVA